MTAAFVNPSEPSALYVLRHADRTLVLAQRLLGWITRAHDLDEELAFANIALDLLGQARMLYTHVGTLDGSGRTEDDYAYWREADQFLSPRLVEQPNGDFAHTMVRQLLHDVYALELWTHLERSSDPCLGAIAQKAVKETRYHVRHAGNWIVRLGTGTAESKRRTQAALDHLWRYTDELFDDAQVDASLVRGGTAADPNALRERWTTTVTATLEAAELRRPSAPGDGQPITLGRSADFEDLITAMQSLQRTHPGATW